MSRSGQIRTAYAAFNRKDADAVFALMKPDVDWPNAIAGTRLIGYEQIRPYWASQWASFDPQVHPLAIEESDNNQVTVHVHEVIRDLTGNLLIDQLVDHVYTFDGDLISRMDILPVDTAGPGRTGRS